MQQDMLTIQIIRIMDQLWLREGLDLKIVTFACMPTGDKRGTFLQLEKLILLSYDLNVFVERLFFMYSSLYYPNFRNNRNGHRSRDST